MNGEIAKTDYRDNNGGRHGAAFRVAWRFKGDAVPSILRLLEGAPHPWIHVCCGAAVIPGEDRRIDLYHPSGEKIDVFELNKHIQGAGAIIIDPPYAWDLVKRQNAMMACARALAPRGRLIVHAPWQPKFTARMMKRLETAFYRDDLGLGFPEAPVLLMAYEKSEDPRYNGAQAVRLKRNGRRAR